MTKPEIDAAMLRLYRSLNTNPQLLCEVARLVLEENGSLCFSEDAHRLRHLLWQTRGRQASMVRRLPRRMLRRWVGH